MARTAPLSQASRLSTLATIAIAIAGLYVAQQVLVPIALSVLLAFLLAPLVTRLERFRVKRIPAVLLVVSVAFLFILSIGYIVGQQAYGLAESLPKYQEVISGKVVHITLIQKLTSLGKNFEKATSQPSTQPETADAGVTKGAADEIAADPIGTLARERLHAASTSQPSPLGSTERNPLFVTALKEPISPITTLGQYLGFVLGPLGTAALVLVFVVFILLEREDLRDRLIRVVSHGRYTVTTRAINDAGTRISRYMLAQSIVNGTYGVVIGIGLAVIGVTVGHGVLFPSFVLWGLLSATLRFIPYVGAWIAASFPIVLSLAVYPGFGVFIAVMILLAGIELFTNNVMEPWLYAASTGLSTMAILIAAVFWTWLWGPVGLLLSTPLTVCLVVLGKNVTQLGFLGVLLGDEAALPPAVTFYQRMLAGDQNEALSVVKQVAIDHGKDHVADEVLIPTLIMARRDRRDDDLTVERENALMDTMGKLVPQLRSHLSSAAIPATAPVALSAVRVLGIPSHHRAEELPLDFLGDMLMSDEVTMAATSTRMLPTEIEQRIDRDHPSIAFIAVLPPGGVVQARYLCRRLHRRFPELKIVVGYWGKPRNFDQLLVRFRSAGASYVTTSLVQARTQIVALLVREAASTAAATGSPELNEPAVVK